MNGSIYDGWRGFAIMLLFTAAVVILTALIYVVVQLISPPVTAKPASRPAVKDTDKKKSK